MNATVENITLFQTELAFALPDSLEDEQQTQLHDILAMQYDSISSVRAGICNPPLILLKFSDLPSEEQVITMRRHIAAMINHL